MKRSTVGAKPYIEIQAEVAKLNDQIQILYKELDPVKADLKVKYYYVNALRAEIETLKAQYNT